MCYYVLTLTNVIFLKRQTNFLKTAAHGIFFLTNITQTQGNNAFIGAYFLRRMNLHLVLFECL